MGDCQSRNERMRPRRRRESMRLDGEVVTATMAVVGERADPAESAWARGVQVAQGKLGPVG